MKCRIKECDGTMVLKNKIKVTKIYKCHKCGNTQMVYKRKKND